MPDVPICLGGLLTAKSPLVTLNKIHAFFLSFTSIDALNNAVTVPVMIVANSLDELQKMSEEKCRLNEFILLSGLKVNRIALDGGKRWNVALLKVGKSEKIKAIEEDEVRPVPSALLDCCFDGQQSSLLAYEGTVSRIVDDALVVFDNDVLVIGVTGVVLNQQVKLFNLAKAPLAHSFVQSLSSSHNISTENIFIFLPWFSSLEIGNEERIDINPPAFPSFCFRDHKTRLRDHLTVLGFAKEASKVANWLWKSHSIGFLFLQTASSECLSYFDDFCIADVAKLVPEKADNENLSRTCRYLTVKSRKDELIIGKLTVCSVSGLSTLSDQTGALLVQTEEVYPDGSLVCIKGFDLVSETFLVDPLVTSTVSRAYIKPSTITCFKMSEEVNFAAEKTYYLVTISSTSPPSLTKIKPAKLQGAITGNCICVIKRDGKGLNIKGTEKKMTLEVSPTFWYEFGEFLNVGSCLIAVKSPHGGFAPQFTVEIETDPKLLKGAGSFSGSSRTLLVSREVHEHVLKKSAPSSIPQDVRSILTASDDESLFVTFQGILKSVEISAPDSNRVNPMFQRLFANFSVGLPIDGARMILKIADLSEASCEINVEYTPSVFPVGLEKDALIEGTNFNLSNGLLSSHSNSYIRIKSGLATLMASHIEFKSDSSVPFHYLADFYGHHSKHPKIPILIHASIESIETLKIVAKCRKCESTISQVCCPIHGRIATDEVDLDALLTCTVNDGTFSAQAVISGLSIVIDMLGCVGRIDQVTKYAAAAGIIDKTSPLFANCSESLKFQRYRIKAVVTEAIQKVDKPAQFVCRKVKVGRGVHQAYSYPGKICLNVVEAYAMDDKDVARRYLDLLEL